VGFAIIVTFGAMLLLGPVDGTTPQSARVLGAVRLAEIEQQDFGKQWECLDALWQHESGWDYTAANPWSSARGIPQGMTELHGLSKGWKQDPDAQVRWGLDYIYGRYGSPCEAWGAWKSRATLRNDGTWFDGWY
jgi:hypothetical protein